MGRRAALGLRAIGMLGPVVKQGGAGPPRAREVQSSLQGYLAVLDGLLEFPDFSLDGRAWRMRCR